MTLIEAILLGMLQGLTEFLPISSSGHLVIGQSLLGIRIPGNTFEVVVHVGTLLSVLFVFKTEWLSLLKTIREKDSNRYVLILLLSTIPAAAVGIIFKDSIENIFDDVELVALALIVTGIILLSTKWIKSGDRNIRLSNGFLIGCAQALAIIPGISRSGSTISTGLAMGLSTKESARFSFLLAIPAIGGAGLLTGIDLVKSGPISLSWDAAIGAFLSSFLVGVISLKWLLGLLESGKFYRFSLYCFLVGGLTLWLG